MALACTVVAERLIRPDNGRTRDLPAAGHARGVGVPVRVSGGCVRRYLPGVQVLCRDMIITPEGTRDASDDGTRLPAERQLAADRRLSSQRRRRRSDRSIPEWHVLERSGRGDRLILATPGPDPEGLWTCYRRYAAFLLARAVSASLA